MRKGKKLLRVAVAAGLLVVAVPSAAMAYALDDGGGQAGTRTEQSGCSLDPRILRMEPQLCSDNQVTTDPGPTTFDPAPAPSVRTENQIGWWMVGIAVTAGGVAGLIAGLRRGRPQALS
jgi:hypothetical protein